MMEPMHIDIPPPSGPFDVTERHSPKYDRTPPRSPTLTYHPAHTLGLPAPDFFNPIASGAHYAGALPSGPHAHEHSKKPHSRRSIGLVGTDPMIEEVYKDVLKDIEEVRPLRLE